MLSVQIMHMHVQRVEDMHDFHLADQIYKAVIDHAKKNNLKKVTAVEIDLGSVVEHGEENQFLFV